MEELIKSILSMKKAATIMSVISLIPSMKRIVRRLQIILELFIKRLAEGKESPECYDQD